MYMVTRSRSTILVSSLMMFLTLLIGNAAFGHGEDKPGPHGGFIRMPGVFHTEVVKVSDSVFKVYLIDLNFKNPVVDQSSVQASLKQNGKVNSVTCSPKKDYFYCGLAKGQKLTSGTLELMSVRAEAVGGKANYELPLRLAPTTEHADNHH